MNRKIIDVAHKFRNHYFPDSLVAFLAGSFIRGEATKYSDLDIVIIYQKLPNAYRESFQFEGFPVEAFVHDNETLNYFFARVDGPSGIPALPQMISEGIEIPGPTQFSRELKALSNAFMDAGPIPWTSEENRVVRYGITDILDDMRDPLSNAELLASASQLYPMLADYYLRSNGFWSAKGKSIPRTLKRESPEMSSMFIEAFDQLFKKGDASIVIDLAEKLLLPDGGLVFAGDKRDAPAEWRKKPLDSQDNKNQNK